MPIEPLIIKPSDHPILLEQIDSDALFVLRKLNKSGYSGYLVGGGVRDLYLGKSPKDFDISTNARPGQVRRLFNNSRTIGRRFRLVQIFFNHGKIIEVSTLRSLSEHDLDGPEVVLAPNNTYGDLDEDAQRRDISINGLFYEIERQTIIDYVGGVADLDRGVIRIIGDPAKRITRDPVRMMRVIRHSARNDFSIETNSWQALCEKSENLALCPPSRLRDEFLKDLYGGESAAWFRLALKSRLFFSLFQIYRDISSEPMPDGTICARRLESIFSAIDRCNQASISAGAHRQPDYFMFALILVPWAAISLRLLDQPLKGGRMFQLASQLRDRINETIGPALNLPRSCRQEITILLINLTTFINLQEQKSWPKWLRRKSYFSKCLLFYHYYREAADSIPVPQSYFSPKERHAPPPSEKPGRKKNSRRKGKPAFSNKHGGGVFGFKK